MSHCLNCGTELSGPFCHKCGQRASVSRLTLKVALVDNSMSAVRMDRRVWPTIFALIYHPWVVIRDYIQGRRIRWTQPVRLIIILCFLNVVMEMFVPQEDEETVVSTVANVQESFFLHLWHSIQAFCDDSEVTMDMLDSVILAPIFLWLFRDWGSRRYNIAEYSTAYLYMSAAGLIWDLITLPFATYLWEWIDLLTIPWWIYVFSQMVIHGFPSLTGWRRVWKIFSAIIICGFVTLSVHLILEPW